MGFESALNEKSKAVKSITQKNLNEAQFTVGSNLRVWLEYFCSRGSNETIQILDCPMYENTWAERGILSSQPR